MEITHTFHMVDELPHRASIFTRVEGGDIQTYISTAYGRRENMADLSWVFTHLSAVWDYEAVSAG